LQREIESEEYVRSKGKPATPVTSRTSSEASNSDDVEMARRVEQELMDEELARRISNADQERLSASQARSMQGAGAVAAPPEPRRRCTVGRVLRYVVPAILIAGIAAGIAIYFTRPEDFAGIFPTPADFRNEDPFNAVTPSEADRWRTQGNGLYLEVIRATDESWYSFFDTAISQWDNGNPDALSLTTSTQAYQYDCVPDDSKLKVCNGDYGNTRWRGINKILLMNGFIVASAARMNEYYLAGSSNEQKQYTMCHGKSLKMGWFC
jgi:hypothetical protein